MRSSPCGYGGRPQMKSVGPSGTTLERFITHGMDAGTRRIVGDLPRGRGVLGALINDARTLRLHDLAEDPPKRKAVSGSAECGSA